MTSPRCPSCASEQLRIEMEQRVVKCATCNKHWTWTNVEDFARFFDASDPERIANADDQTISWAIDRTMDHLFDLLTPASREQIVESIYGPDMSAGVKDIFAGQVEDVLNALRAHAVARVRSQRADIIASLKPRSDNVM